MNSGDNIGLLPRLDPPRSETLAVSGSFSSVAARLCLTFAAGLAVIRAAVHVHRYWISDLGIDHPAGVMIAMALDLTHGVFYRPLFGPVGYGGTRYFPLYFVLHALLVKLGVPILLGAYLLSGLSVLLLIGGVFCLLVRIGVGRWLSAAVAGTVLASVSAQSAIIGPHPDGFASALNIWALTIIAGGTLNARRITVAAMLLTLAWSAKLTMCFGLVLAVVWLVSKGLRREALRLAVETILGYLIVVVLMVVFSSGRVIEIFRKCALGGANWKRVLEGPLFMVWNAFYKDLNVLLLVFLAVTALGAELLESPVKSLKQLPVLLLIAALATTAAIFGSPGTNVNQLLDLQAAAIIFLGSLCVRPSPVQRQIGIYALVCATLIPIGLGTLGAFLHPGAPADATAQKTAGHLNEVVEVVRRVDGPVLAENPAITVLAGRSPYVLDPWMFSLLRKRIPGFEQPLLQELRLRSFGAVVLIEDPETEYGRQWYDRQHFGPGFRETLAENYQLLAVIAGQRIYVPKPAATSLTER